MRRKRHSPVDALLLLQYQLNSNSNHPEVGKAASKEITLKIRFSYSDYAEESMGENGGDIIAVAQTPETKKVTKEIAQ